ncbi:MAG: TetR/AcrR family transcriptional regulator [Euzebya sp.]
MPTDTDEVILDATFATLADIGLARLSLEEVASRAGVSRQTVYRHFGSRSALIAATVVREEQRLLVQVALASQPHQELEPALRAALHTLLTWTRDHALLGKLLASEPEGLLPFLVSGDAPVLGVARAAILDVLGNRLEASGDGATAADLLARVMLSFAMNPPENPPEIVARKLAALIVQGLGRPTPPTHPPNPPPPNSQI